jgi:large subunit ribosomal protein L21
MYAVIASGGKQERVEVGSRIAVEMLEGEDGSSVTFAPVLLVDGERVITTPDELATATVSGTIVGATKGPKIHGFTYKNKTNSRRRFGHRQHYTVVEVTEIAAGGASTPRRAPARAAKA